MSAIVHIIFPLTEKFQEVILDQQGTAQYAHDFEDGPVQFEVVFDDGNKAVGDDGDVDLNPHSILTVAPESFDAEMLLDPFKEQLDLPAVSVEQGDVLRRKVEIVGVVDKGASEVFGIVDNPAQLCRVIPRVAFARKADSLVKEYTICSIKNVFPIDDFEFGPSLLSYDEECSAEMYSEKSGEVEVSAVEDVAGIGFVINPIHRLVVTDIGVGDPVEYRYLCDDVNLRVDFDTRLCTAEERPAKDGHTEVDGSGIDGVESPVKFKLFGDSPLLGKRHHIERELLEDLRLAEHIGFREGVPDDSRVAESELVAPFCMGSGNICELSESAASKELSENEDKQLIPVRKTPVLSSIIEFGYNPAELPLRQIHCDLGEYVSSVVHLCSFLSETKVRNSSPGQYFSLITKCA